MNKYKVYVPVTVDFDDIERNAAISGCNIGKWFVERKFLN